MNQETESTNNQEQKEYTEITLSLTKEQLEDVDRIKVLLKLPSRQQALYHAVERMNSEINHQLLGWKIKFEHPACRHDCDFGEPYYFPILIQ